MRVSSNSCARAQSERRPTLGNANGAHPNAGKCHRATRPICCDASPWTSLDGDASCALRNKAVRRNRTNPNRITAIPPIY